MSKFVYLIAFGGNVGDRESFARGALDMLGACGHVGRQSHWHRTTPLTSDRYDTRDHAEYLNFVFEFVTTHSPEALYREICAIEDFFGHDRTRRWLPRAVDLDLLFCSQARADESVFQEEHPLTHCSRDSTLRVPHPEVWNRLFLLEMIENELKIGLQSLRSSLQMSR